MAKKQTFIVGSTNPNTESRTDAQLNTAWNKYEVLKSGELDGVLNAMSAQTAINADEITNALDVYNITPDPDDNTQLKQLLTQMDDKINQVTTGGEIIGSFWFGKTTAGFTVPAPTDIDQTYLDFTTLEYYRSLDGSTWTLEGTLTLPALQDAIVLITSKFWDIIEQTNQYGGRAIYAQDLSSWVYYPTIISVDLSGYMTLGTNQTSTGDKTFTGTVEVPTVSTLTDNSNKAASTAFVLDILKAIYPVGSIYIAALNTPCPMAALFGTWTLVSANKALWTGDGTNAGSTIAAGLPNVYGQIYAAQNQLAGASGALSLSGSGPVYTHENRVVQNQHDTLEVNASLSNPIYGNSNTVQPPAYVVNVWLRTA